MTFIATPQNKRNTQHDFTITNSAAARRIDMLRACEPTLSSLPQLSGELAQISGINSRGGDFGARSVPFFTPSATHPYLFVYTYRLRGLKKPYVDNCILKGFKQGRDKKVPVSGPLLRAKDEHFASQLVKTNFKASAGWQDEFKQRNEISFNAECASRMCEQAWDQVKVETIKNCLKKAGIIRKENYGETVTESAPAIDNWEKVTPDPAISYVDFVSVDEDVAVCGEVTDTDIVPEVLNNNIQAEDGASGYEEDNSSVVQDGMAEQFKVIQFTEISIVSSSIPGELDLLAQFKPLVCELHSSIICGIHWAEQGSKVLYISATPLNELPPPIHGTPNLGTEALSNIRFLYLPTWQDLLKHLYSIHLHAHIAQVVIIQGLEHYCYLQGKPFNEMHTALIFASLMDATSVCGQRSNRPALLITSLDEQDVPSDKLNRVIDTFFLDVIWLIESENKFASTEREIQVSNLLTCPGQPRKTKLVCGAVFYFGNGGSRWNVVKYPSLSRSPTIRLCLHVQLHTLLVMVEPLGRLHALFLYMTHIQEHERFFEVTTMRNTIQGERGWNRWNVVKYPSLSRSPTIRLCLHVQLHTLLVMVEPLGRLHALFLYMTHIQEHERFFEVTTIINFTFRTSLRLGQANILHQIKGEPYIVDLLFKVLRCEVEAVEGDKKSFKQTHKQRQVNSIMELVVQEGLRGSAPTFAWSQSRKAFRKNNPQCTRGGSNPGLPIFDSLVQHKSSALDPTAIIAVPTDTEYLGAAELAISAVKMSSSVEISCLEVSVKHSSSVSFSCSDAAPPSSPSGSFGSVSTTTGIEPHSGTVSNRLSSSSLGVTGVFTITSTILGRSSSESSESEGREGVSLVSSEDCRNKVLHTGCSTTSPMFIDTAFKMSDEEPLQKSSSEPHQSDTQSSDTRSESTALDVIKRHWLIAGVFITILVGTFLPGGSEKGIGSNRFNHIFSGSVSTRTLEKRRGEDGKKGGNNIREYKGNTRKRMLICFGRARGRSGIFSEGISLLRKSIQPKALA
uniref:HTH CENPB-type domain-containing protein n=1 Tax=Timema cristinae TaxID=61476 RepID=A0A7R9CFU4_TIMCR|nr:unnamed protein product [Timema cristinae]